VDDIVTFGALNHDCILQIVDIELATFYKRVEENGLKLEITDAAKNLVADRGFDIQYGARPLKRAIQSEIEDPLSEMLLREEAKTGDTIVIDVEDGKIVTRVEKR
jgi:ATP-dependent Clp protease ATP-binding subunit ClpC